MPARIRSTGPGGWGHGHGRGKIPSQQITSPETMKYIKESEMHTKKREQMKNEKDIVYKRALLQKRKRDRLVKNAKSQ